MKKNSGYISINVLILMMIVVLLIIGNLDSLVMNKDLSNSRLDQIKAFNSSESKILQILEMDKSRDDLLLKYVLKSLRNKEYEIFKIKLEEGDLINREVEFIGNDTDNYNDIIEVSFDKDLNMRSRPNVFHIISRSKIGRSNNSLIGDIIITNNIFTLGESLIVPEKDGVLDKDIEKFFKSFKDENNYLFNQDKKFMNIFEEDSCFLQICRNEDKDIILIKDMEKYISLDSNYIKIFAMNENTNLHIEKYMDVDSIINLSGIIYVEGNLKINNNFNFEGIIIVKNGRIIVDDKSFFKNRGLVISNNRKVLKGSRNIELKYDEDLIFKMGPSLPGYIDFKIKNIREE